MGAAKTAGAATVSRTGNAAATGCGVIFGAVWILGWSAGTLFFDFMAVRGVVMQSRAAHYRTAQGIILDSRVHESSDSEGGTSYSAKLRYAYSVDDRRYEGDRIRYGIKSGGRKRAHAFVQKYRPGTPITVHYDPARPSESVLETSINGADVFIFLFLTPFNLVMLGSWVFAIKVVCGPRAADQRFMKRVRQEPGGVIVVTLPGCSPVTVAVSTAMGVSFLLIFVVGLATAMKPSVTFTAIALGVVVAAAVRSGWRAHNRRLAGEGELEIDPARRTITFPLRKRKPTRTTIRFDQVDAVDVRRKEKKDDDTTTVRYVPAVRWTHGDDIPHTTALPPFDEEAEAQAMRNWLVERVKPGSKLV